MTKLEKVLCFVPLCSTWDRPNGKVFAAQGRSNLKLVVQSGSISWRLRQRGVDKAMTKLDTDLCFVPLCSTWGRRNGKFFAARDRNNSKLTVQ